MSVINFCIDVKLVRNRQTHAHAKFCNPTRPAELLSDDVLICQTGIANRQTAIRTEALRAGQKRVEIATIKSNASAPRAFRFSIDYSARKTWTGSTSVARRVGIRQANNDTAVMTI